MLSTSASVIRARGDALVIGALTTYTELIRSPLVRRRLPILAEAARWVGSPQIQNRGTIGGNIANASPAGDALPVLAVAEAVIVLRSVDGERRVPFDSFYTGYRQTVMRADELIVSVEAPPVEGRQWFRKVGTRAAQAISKVVVAAVRADHPRIALGSVAPTVVRAPRTEVVLAGGGTVAEAQAVLMDEIRPIDDQRSTAAYLAAGCRPTCWRSSGPTPDGPDSVGGSGDGATPPTAPCWVTAWTGTRSSSATIHGRRPTTEGLPRGPTSNWPSRDSSS